MIEQQRIEDALAIISDKRKYVEYAYFFDKLMDPDWILPLSENGFFTDPPSAGSNRYIWPESRYLLRVVEQAPKQVAAIAAALPETDNEMVHQDFTQAACKMPAVLAEPWAKREAEWVGDQEQLYRLLPTDLGDLIVHLAENGRTQIALKLAKALLSVHEDPKLAEKLAEEEANPPKEDEFPLSYTPEPQVKFDQYIYETILQKHIPVLVEKIGIEAFKILCDLLIDATKYSNRPDETKDFSRYARPTIEDNEDDLPSDVKYPLSGAVRDAALMIIQRDPEEFDAVMAHLDNDDLKQWSFFQRLALYLVRRYPDSPSAYVSKYLHDRDLFDSYHAELEYWQLASARFGELDPEIQEEIIAWILDQEKDEEKEIKRRYKELHEKNPTHHEMKKFMCEWVRDVLAPIEGYLPNEIRQRYKEAVKIVGKKEPPSLMAGQVSTSWVGPTSPLSTNDMSTMTVAELIDHMKTWEPPGNWNSPSRDGYARGLEVVVGIEPDKYALHYNEFTVLHPTYIRGLLQGFHEAAKEDRPFNWDKVLRLCKWVLNQKREFGPEIMSLASGDDREETNWGWARKRIANLLEQGFREKEHAEIPFNHREIAWSILEQLTLDPEPDIDGDRQYLESQDPAFYSINTVRGQAMHTVMFYAMWLRRNLDIDHIAPLTDIAPEVIDILNLHLDPVEEPTLTIRSVYGRWYPWLVTWDEAWAKSNTIAIFPDEPEMQEFWDTAWGTYVVYNRPYNNVFPLIQGHYKRALTRFGEMEVTLAGGHTPDESLAQHLILYFGRGLIGLEDGSLIDSLFKQAPDEVRAHAIRFVGNTFDITVPEDTLERMKGLWDWRWDAINKAEDHACHVMELAEFGTWVSTGAFNSKWVIDRLSAILQLTGKVIANEEMVKQLAKIVKKFPREVVEIYRAMVASEPEYWKMYEWREPGKDLLLYALNSGDDTAKQSAESLVNELVSKGYLSYREELPSKASGMNKSKMRK